MSAVPRLGEHLRDARVLIVDDTELGREMIASLLREAGLRSLSFASDGIEALSLLAGDTPDLMILDIMMPGKDGYEVCREVRSGPLGADLPILVQTALTFPGDRARAFREGASDVVSKPVDPAELIARVRIQLEKLRLINELRHFRARVESEFKTARSMFRHLLPSDRLCREIERGSDARFLQQRLTPKGLGSDLWGVVPIERGRFGVYLTDMGGRGLTAVLRAFRAHSLLRELDALADRPGRLLTEMNERAVRLRSRDDTLPIIYGVVDTLSSTLTYAAAGDNAPVVFLDGRDWAVTGDPTGPALASGAGVVFEERTLPFPRGALLILCSNATRTTLDEAGTPLVEIAREAIRSDGEAGGFALTAGVIETTVGTNPERDHILLWVARE